MLSPVIVEYMTRQLALPETAPSKRHLIALGSLIDTSFQDATIWGSGVLNGEKKWWWRKFRKLDVRCVRGPETRKVLEKNGYVCPEVYGDPAILMPLIYPAPKTRKIEYEYRVVQHYEHSTSPQNYLSPITLHWQSFIDELLKAKLIISSSLHDIILAESYGIPAILLDDHNMNLFKYRDYYYSTGRREFPVANTIDEALTMEPAPLPELDSLRENLLNSFPHDLWE